MVLKVYTSNDLFLEEGMAKNGWTVLHFIIVRLTQVTTWIRCNVVFRRSVSRTWHSFILLQCIDPELQSFCWDSWQAFMLECDDHLDLATYSRQLLVVSTFGRCCSLATSYHRLSYELYKKSFHHWFWINIGGWPSSKHLWRKNLLDGDLFYYTYAPLRVRVNLWLLHGLSKSRTAIHKMKMNIDNTVYWPTQTASNHKLGKQKRFSHEYWCISWLNGYLRK